MSHPETVKIVSSISEDNPLGYIVINKDDFDEKKHEIFDETKSADPSKMTVAQLRATLTAAGIEFDAGAKKDDLIALLPQPE